MPDDLKRLALPGSHDSIVDWLGRQERGKVLDVPCGSGILSRELSKLGFSVFCCDIDPENFSLDSSYDFRTTNLNRDRLPYDDEEFDYIVCSNGMHRLFNISAALSEFYRVLKAGGKAVISFPNYGSTARRLKFLLGGSIGASIDKPIFYQGLNGPEANFRFPLTPEKFIHASDQSGLIVSNVSITGLGMVDYLCFPLALLIKALSVAFPWARLAPGNRFNLLKGGDTAHYFIYKP